MHYANVSERNALPPQVGVTTVILALGPEQAAGRPGLWVALVQRDREPFRNAWALPGGELKSGRSLEQSAYAALASTTDLHPQYMEQLYTFGDPNRSHGGIPMVSICYWALMERAELTQAAETNRHNARWFPEDDLPALAFDHQQIVEYALWRVRHRLDTPRLAVQLVGEEFTLRQLHEVYQAILDADLDLANFRRKILATGQLEETGRKLAEGKQRPATLYRFRKEVLESQGQENLLPQGVFAQEMANLQKQAAHDQTASDPLAALTTV